MAAWALFCSEAVDGKAFGSEWQHRLQHERELPSATPTTVA